MNGDVQTLEEFTDCVIMLWMICKVDRVTKKQFFIKKKTLLNEVGWLAFAFIQKKIQNLINEAHKKYIKW